MLRPPTKSASTPNVRSNPEWIAWGERDPFWAVATEPNRAKSGSSPWTPVEFYGSGESDWTDFYHHWQEYGLRLDSCLEIGCGAGRLTHALVNTFDRVIAIDVSPGMIAKCREAINDPKMETILTSGHDLPVVSDSIGAVFSTHVLQHLDSTTLILGYLKEGWCLNPS